MMSWNSIETAPRDGTPVDLWHKGGFRMIDCWWTDDDCWSCALNDDDFTHWMLPTSPCGEKIYEHSVTILSDK
jgi:hypothetical protein